MGGSDCWTGWYGADDGRFALRYLGKERGWFRLDVVGDDPGRSIWGCGQDFDPSGWISTSVHDRSFFVNINSLFVVLVLLMIGHFTFEGLHCSVDHGGILLDFLLSKLVSEEAGKPKLVFFVWGVVVELGRCWLSDRKQLLGPSPIMERLGAFISYCRQ